MYSKILVPLDGSPLAELAVNHAAEIARGTGAEVIFLQVVHGPLASVPEAGRGAELEALKEAADRGLAYLDTVASRLRDENIRTRSEVIEGEPAAGILGFAHKENVDAIVMSTHGRGGLSKMIMGSVAQSVALTTKRPVMLVKPERARVPRLEEADTFLSAH
jgi:nucleotide-binding universal stress UspA family protein